MCSHHLKKGDGADEVVVVVKQGLVHALTNSFEPSKVNDSLKPAATVGSGRVNNNREQRETDDISMTNNSCPGGGGDEKMISTDNRAKAMFSSQNFTKIFKIPRHIESLDADAYMKH
jgi:hypothetical protein